MNFIGKCEICGLLISKPDVESENICEFCFEDETRENEMFLEIEAALADDEDSL